jgi:hypothetical protein
MLASALKMCIAEGNISGGFRALCVAIRPRWGAPQNNPGCETAATPG